MAKHPKGQRRIYCSFAKSNTLGSCPHYKPSHYGLQCRGWEQGITTFGNLTMFHCAHDPPTKQQLYLPL